MTCLSASDVLKMGGGEGAGNLSTIGRIFSKLDFYSGLICAL
jgi:hypothetical protein